VTDTPKPWHLRGLRELWQARRRLLSGMDQIDEGLYQGGAVDGLPAGVAAVLDLQQEHEDVYAFTDVERLRAFAWMPIADGFFPGVVWLEVAVRNVMAWRDAGWPVLVHCAAGVSRSGMVVIAYHMKLNGWTVGEAAAFVKQKRPVTNPNPSFMEGLVEYQKFLRIGGVP
jgi:hypothetical protein